MVVLPSPRDAFNGVSAVTRTTLPCLRGASGLLFETMAAQLKEETDKLLDSVLYTTSMNMKNGFHMSDF